MTPTPTDAVLRTFHEGQLRLRQRLEACFYFAMDADQFVADANQIIEVEHVQSCLQLAQACLIGGLKRFPDEIMPEMDRTIEETREFIHALGRAH